MHVSISLIPIENGGTEGDLERYRQLRGGYAFEKFPRTVVFAPGDTEKQLVVVGMAASALTGTIRQADGAVVDGALASAKYAALARIKADGSFVLAGVPTGLTSVVGVVLNSGMCDLLEVHPNGAVQDIGTVTVPSRPPANGYIDVLIAPVTRRDPFLPRLSAGVVIVSASGSTIVGYSVLSGGEEVAMPGGSTRTRVRDRNSPSGLPGLPAGEFYLLPGPFRMDDSQIAFIQALRRGADVSQLGVPRVVVTAGQTTTVDIDDPVAVEIAAQQAASLP